MELSTIDTALIIQDRLQECMEMCDTSWLHNKGWDIYNEIELFLSSPQPEEFRPLFERAKEYIELF